MTDSKREKAITAIQDWSDQKYGSPFSVSACHDLLSVIEDAGFTSGETAKWRVFNDIFNRDWWGIEIDDNNDDAEPILYAKPIKRKFLERIVDAHNAAIAALIPGDRAARALLSGSLNAGTFGDKTR